MQSLKDIRSTFLDFFAKRGHDIVPSSPLVPRNDPTLLFTNAGMVQFKNVFTGQESRANSRAVSAQKCVRAGGKHNDLDNVGYTARHHTFFEMLGNFSFGDYFKEEAILFAWDLVTKEFCLNPDRLTITVYSEDDDARRIWRKVSGFPDARIIGIPTSDNFWMMGDTGPCGPCSELFYDYGDRIAGGPPGSPDADGDRFTEFWNLVFMQFEQRGPGERASLPKPSIDTGMGLERMASILQGKTSNYDTDLFQHLIAASAELTRTPANGPHAASHRVVADHLRAASFLIADGVLPSNEGRGYVLRRIMRRAMRHAHMMGAKEPLMHRLVPVLVTEMGQAYGELVRAEALIKETLQQEETRFRTLLERGLRLLDEELDRLGSAKTLAGDVAFKLYDTFGFPLDLTQDALRERGIGVDTDGFAAQMTRQREDARRAWSGSGEAATDDMWFRLRDEHGATEFLGYETEMVEGKITAILVDGKPVQRLDAGQAAGILVNQTPFYGESGGQGGDSGIIRKGSARFVVRDTQKKLGALHVHIGTLEGGTLSVGDEVALEVDHQARMQTRANHSATHLLHEALRRTLGAHIAQKGSLVNAERLRFDFSHAKALTQTEMEGIEATVNAVIRDNEEVTTRLMRPEDAIEAGAIALFGEDYGEEVRVLSMPSAHDDARPYSVELCGGTHVRRLADIGLFRIIGESAVAAGVRRIEALTGDAARRYLANQAAIARDAASELKTSPAELVQRVAILADERRKLEREVADLRRQLALGGGGKSGGGSEAEKIGALSAVLRVVDNVAAKDLKPLADDAKAKIGSGVVVFIAVEEGKASIVAGVTADLTAKISAVDLVRLASGVLGGKGGGGRPDMAQAGGPDGARADEALAALRTLIAGIAV